MERSVSAAPSVTQGRGSSAAGRREGGVEMSLVVVVLLLLLSLLDLAAVLSGVDSRERRDWNR